MYSYKALLLDWTYEEQELDPETEEEITVLVSCRSLAYRDENSEIKAYNQPLEGVIQIVMGEPTSQEALVRISEPIEPMPGGWTLME